MGRIVITEYISVDGVVEAPSGSEAFSAVHDSPVSFAAGGFWT